MKEGKVVQESIEKIMIEADDNDIAVLKIGSIRKIVDDEVELIIGRIQEKMISLAYQKKGNKLVRKDIDHRKVELEIEKIKCGE